MGSVGGESRHWLVDISAQLRPSVRVGPVWLFIGADVGVIALPLRIEEDAGVVARYHGVSLGGFVGLRWRFKGSALDIPAARLAPVERR